MKTLRAMENYVMLTCIILSLFLGYSVIFGKLASNGKEGAVTFFLSFIFFALKKSRLPVD